MATQGKKLLVADDSLTIQKVIRLALSNEGYEIQTVSDGNDAIQQISLFRPAVILIDVSLPGKTAFEVKKIINEQGDFGDVKFILMSSAFEKVDEDLEKTVRFHGRLTKPFDPAHLRQVLTEVIAVGEEEAAQTQGFEPPPLPKPEPTPPPARELPDFSNLKFPERPSFSSHAPTVSKPVPPPSAQTAGPRKPLLDPPPPELTPELDPIEEEFADEFTTDLSRELNLDPEEPLDLDSISIEPRENLETLWNEEEFRPSGTTETPAPPKPEYSDIRQLTESTIRMTGLDDFDWSVNEDSAKKNFEPTEVGDRTLTGLSSHEPSLPAFAGMKDLSGSNFSLDPTPVEPPARMSPPNRPSEEFSIQPPPPPPFVPRQAAPSEPSAPQLSTQQIEQMIERQVQEKLQSTLEKLSQKILPEVAERMIKQEIRRMLEEQP